MEIKQEPGTAVSNKLLMAFLRFFSCCSMAMSVSHPLNLNPVSHIVCGGHVSY
jgi:hypothetical protein